MLCVTYLMYSNQWSSCTCYPVNSLDQFPALTWLILYLAGRTQSPVSSLGEESSLGIISDNNTRLLAGNTHLHTALPCLSCYQFLVCGRSGWSVWTVVASGHLLVLPDSSLWLTLSETPPGNGSSKLPSSDFLSPLRNNATGFGLVGQPQGSAGWNASVFVFAELWEQILSQEYPEILNCLDGFKKFWLENIPSIVWFRYLFCPIIIFWFQLENSHFVRTLPQGVQRKRLQRLRSRRPQSFQPMFLVQCHHNQ